MSTSDYVEIGSTGLAYVEWPDDMDETSPDKALIAAVARHVVTVFPDLFTFNGVLQRIRQKSTGVSVKTLDLDDERALIKDAVCFHKGPSENYAAMPYFRAWFRDAVIHDVKLLVPSCTGVVTHPIITSSGRVVAKRGYETETGLFIDISPEMEELYLWEILDQERIDFAREVLGDNYEHKTFYSPADKSRYIAVLLTAVMTSCYDVSPPVYANNASADSIEARTLFYELNKILHGRATSPDYLHLKAYVVQRKNISCMRKGKNLPIFLAHSDKNQTPNWPCYVGSNVAIQVLFDDSRDDVTKEIAKEFESFRVGVFESLVTLIQAWYQAGKPAPTTPSAFDPAFDEWYYHVAGVLEHAGYTSISEDLTV